MLSVVILSVTLLNVVTPLKMLIKLRPGAGDADGHVVDAGDAIQDGDVRLEAKGTNSRSLGPGTYSCNSSLFLIS